jgi:MOSC domain-containing protein YiiM
MQEKGLSVKPGDFAENITTEGFDLLELPIRITYWDKDENRQC